MRAVVLREPEEAAAVRERVRELERLGFLGITLQQPLGLNFRSAWKLIS